MSESRALKWNDTNLQKQKELQAQYPEYVVFCDRQGGMMACEPYASLTRDPASVTGLHLCPDFDHLQYAKWTGMAWHIFITCTTSRVCKNERLE